MTGSLSREAASLWAGKRHVEPSSDPAIEEALDILTLIDAPHVDSHGQPMDYMYDLGEVEDAQESLTPATGSSPT